MELGLNDLLKVLDPLFDIRTKWYDIGLRLNVPIGTLEEIKAAGQTDDNGRLCQVLVAWLKSGKATWTAICRALRHRTIDEIKLADTLQAKHLSGSCCLTCNWQ